MGKSATESENPGTRIALLTLAPLQALITMKTILLWNTIRKGRKMSIVIAFAIGALFLWFAMNSAAIDLFSVLPQMFLKWSLAIVLAYFFIFVFTSDLLIGHTLNWGQMSTDHVYLSTLPIPAFPLLIGKLYERLLTDWLGVFFLLSGFVSIATRMGFEAIPFLIAIIMYVESELLIGLFITLLTILLQRFLRPSTLKNAFSLLGYATAIMGLLPYFWVASNPQNAFYSIIEHFSLYTWASTILSPFYWIAETLISGTFNAGFWKWQGFWLINMAIGSCSFCRMANNQWLTFTHPGIKRRVKKESSWFSPMIRKDILLLFHDLNLLLNAIFMPLTVIFLQIWALKKFNFFSTDTSFMNLMAASSMYFCLFGPINAIGSEGRSIGTLETLPISGHKIIAWKTFLWAAIAEIIFLPLIFVIGKYFLDFEFASMTFLSIWIFFLIIGFAWVAVSFSAIFANYQARVLQQSSTFTGKILAALSMSVAVPTKELNAHSVMNLVVFLLVAIALHAKANEALEARLDPDKITTPEFKFSDAFLIILGTLAIQGVLHASGLILFRGIENTIWPWLISYCATLMVLGISTISYVKRRFYSSAKALGLTKPEYRWFPFAFLAAIISTIFCRFYFNLVVAARWEIFSQTSPFWETTSAAFGIWKAFFLLFLVYVLFASIIQEMFFRGFVDRAIQRMGLTGKMGILLNGVFFALLHPGLSFLPFMVMGILAAWLFRLTQNLWPCIFFHAATNFLIMLMYI